MKKNLCLLFPLSIFIIGCCSYKIIREENATNSSNETVHSFPVNEWTVVHLETLPDTKLI